MKKLKKETNDAAFKRTRSIFILKKENKAIKDRIIRYILFEHEEEDYYKPVRVGNFWSNSYIKYKSKDDRKTLSVKIYLDEIRLYLKDIIKNLTHEKFN